MFGARPHSGLDFGLDNATRTVGVWSVAKRSLREACERIEGRIAGLEQGQLKMGGTWKAGERYRENTLVSYHGGLWISCCSSSGVSFISRHLLRRDELLEEDSWHVWDTVWDIKEQGEEAGLPLRR